MTTLGNYHHDFPKLAKQSGYFFQLSRGKVNWSEIENLNIDDIIENRNFQLLEQNLTNVVNCNLERDYDLKILDKNFVKLFRLAQLGVDYLSYCELYLDRCVVLLQEQLIAFKEECELLKQENIKKSEELKRSKKKNKVQNYQCEKCEKIFISEIYLKCHDKRRHSNPSTPKSLDSSLRKCTDRCQQTEEEKRRSTTSTQTVAVEEDMFKPRETEISRMKNDNLKIENLEKELEDLKSRLKKAENTLTEKSEVFTSTLPRSHNFPAPVFYPSVLPFVPSYLPQPRNDYFDPSPGYQVSVPQYPQPVSGGGGGGGGGPHPAPKEVAPVAETSVMTSVKDEADKTTVENPNEVPRERETVIDCSAITKEINSLEKSKTTRTRKKLDRNKENIDPNRGNLPTKPLPLPRKVNKLFETEPETEETPKRTEARESAVVEPFSVADSSDANAELVVTTFSNESITRSSTPLKEKPEAERHEEIEESIENLIKERNLNSSESLIVQETERKPKSLIKKMVVRNSPKLHELGKNLKRSLTNLYESVSSTGKDLTKGSKDENSKSKVVDGLNNQLRELGVDPDWNGIPKKTMREKLKALKHKRTFLAKENPMYPAIRKSIETNIFKKLNKNYVGSNKGNGNQGGNEQESIETQPSWATQETLFKEQKPEVKKAVMYDIETESESVSDLEGVDIPEVSDLEEDQGNHSQKARLERVASVDVDSDGGENVGLAEKEFDLSVFQVQKEGKRSETKEISDSDSDVEFLENFENHSFKAISGYLEKNSKELGERIEKAEGDDDEMSKDLFELLDSEEEAMENVLKSQVIQSQPQQTNKKKVLFADDALIVQKSEEIEFGRRFGQTKSFDSWSTKNDWNKDVN